MVRPNLNRNSGALGSSSRCVCARCRALFAWYLRRLGLSLGRTRRTRCTRCTGWLRCRPNKRTSSRAQSQRAIIGRSVQAEHASPKHEMARTAWRTAGVPDTVGVGVQSTLVGQGDEPKHVLHAHLVLSRRIEGAIGERRTATGGGGGGSGSRVGLQRCSGRM